MASPERPTRHVVVTGLGIISPLGNTLDALWDSLTSGRSGVTPLKALPSEALPISFAGEVHDFTGDVSDFGALEGDTKKAVRKGLKVMCRECQMGVASALRALDHAGLKTGSFDPERTGIVFGSDYMLTEPEEFSAGIGFCTQSEGRFDYTRWGEEGMRQLTPLWLLKYLPNMPACHIAIYNDLRGPNNSLTLREASANLAIGEAYQTILRGGADTMLAGATGTRVHPMKTMHVVQQEEMVTNGFAPSAASRPYDLKRRGMVLGEGAGTIVLEELETARARGAQIYAEIVGASSSSVSDRNFVALRGVAMQNAIRSTLRSAGWSPSDVGHVHGHGLSTRSCDAEEAAAIREALGKTADDLPVTAAKSYFGNLGAGSGAVEFVASVLALSKGKLFPVLNYETPDPECAIHVAGADDTQPGKSFINLNVTPQGQAACVAVQAV